MSLFHDFLSDCFTATESDFGTVALIYGGEDIIGTFSVLEDSKELVPAGFERQIRATFTTIRSRFDLVFASPEVALGKSVTVGGNTYRVDRVETTDAICNIVLMSITQAR